jgi:hypothetical protein
MGKIVRAGAGAGMFDKLEPELDAGQKWTRSTTLHIAQRSIKYSTAKKEF